MRVLSVVCSESVIRDAENHQVTAYNILDDISAEAYPVLIPRIAIYFFSERTVDDAALYDIDIIIFNNEKELFKRRVQLNFLDKLKNKAVLKINGLTISDPGYLRVALVTPNGTSLYDKIILLSIIQTVEPLKS